MSSSDDSISLFVIYGPCYMELRLTGEPDATEMGTSGSGRGGWKSALIVTRWPSTPHKPQDNFNEATVRHVTACFELNPEGSVGKCHKPTSLQ